MKPSRFTCWYMSYVPSLGFYRTLILINISMVVFALFLWVAYGSWIQLLGAAVGFAIAWLGYRLTMRVPTAMICLNCENDQFIPALGEINQEYKGDLINVVTPVMECTQCGWITIGRWQLDELRKRTKEAYLAKNI